MAEVILTIKEYILFIFCVHIWDVPDDVFFINQN